MGTKANIVVGGATVLIGSDLGFIKGGIKLTPTREQFTPEDVDSLYGPIKKWLTKEEYAFDFTLMEPTQANIKIWLDSTNAPGAGPDPIPLDIGHGPSGDTGVVTENILVMTGIVPGNIFVRTITVTNAVLETPGEMTIAQSGEASCPIVMTALWDDSNNRFFLISDATT